jgi:subtilisin family serine protease
MRWSFVGVVLLALPLTGVGTPNDPLAAQQWHLQHVGALDAWDTGQGEEVVVAVLDTGVDLDHPDLLGRLVEGLDLVEPGTPPDDPHGHGTIVAGTIAAVAGNGLGVAGAAPRALVMPVRVLDGEGGGTSTDVAEGIRWATAEGAAVVNLSLAEAGRDTGRDAAGVSGLIDADVEEAIEEAAAAGVLVVAAAGNDGLSPPYSQATPALVVGATDAEDLVWPQSNRDARTLFAPGVEILATWHDGRYARSDGTSFAAPVVSAAAAILIQAGASGARTRERLVETAVDIGTGLGRLDVAAAAAGVAPPSLPGRPQHPSAPPPAAEVAAPPAASPGPTRLPATDPPSPPSGEPASVRPSGTAPAPPVSFEPVVPVAAPPPSDAPGSSPPSASEPEVVALPEGERAAQPASSGARIAFAAMLLIAAGAVALGTRLATGARRRGGAR